MPQTDPMTEKNMVRVAQCPICHANVYCCIVRVFTDPIYECLRESEEKNIRDYRDAGYDIKDIEHATAGGCDCYTPNGIKKLISRRDRDILTQAADSFCIECKKGFPGYDCLDPSTCTNRRAILAPLNKE